MPESYTVTIIVPDEKDRLLHDLHNERWYDRKANIHGMCIELLTDSKDFKEMWEDNFYYMSDDVRPHGRIVACRDQGGFRVLYEPISKTCFVLNTDYYGWVKSLALAVAADFLEDYVSIHSRFSIHGSCIDFAGRGIAMIAPSGTGKTTHSFGLLFLPKAKLVADDWFFVKPTKDDVVAYGSERNSYIRDDIGKAWHALHALVTNTTLDTRGRGIADIETVLGAFKRRSQTVLSKVIILKRDENDPTIVRNITVDEAMAYLESVTYCNPHQLVTDERKQRIRRAFFRRMLGAMELYLVNTTRPVAETHAAIRTIVAGM